MAYTSSQARCIAVSSRDSNASSAFVYAVKTTGIYCRPNCASRLARRANIVFFDDAGRAETEGFRPCKRCQPQSTKRAGIGAPSERVAAAVNEAKRIIELNASECSGKGSQITLNELAMRVGLTPRYLHKVFAEHVGCSPRDHFLATKRLRDSDTYSPVDDTNSTGKNDDIFQIEDFLYVPDEDRDRTPQDKNDAEISTLFDAFQFPCEEIHSSVSPALMKERT
ncbi:hypothetical protein P152DRAFT_209397 [Eremomyces bilateralis CBS 781.70]|uniref:HTH araC/xylS-type domain-containing protein n=1 Tax=Eremomyces bilateralis CBS 781.70 TaxID=1392243 RepID=A0A6G1FSX3_9PEZI|nr:uncharacterized protein P152DRAFT_209397 [Eremomyces bilateralis CBS 781.70]KAF1808779.1 hypothetical protein P152DRAFT_209397 [Eremomyces bilateralis CBS 781.70]